MKRTLLQSILLGAMMLLVAPAWAQETEDQVSFYFEDEVNPFTDNARITSAIEYNDALGSNVLGWTNSGNANNGYAFSCYDFSDVLVNNTEEVDITFDYYNTKGGRSILSIGDAGVRGNTGGSSKQTYNGSGAFFRIGSDKSNAFICGTNYSQDDICDKWVRVHVVVNLVDKNLYWDVTVWDEETKSYSFHEAFHGDYYSGDGAVCSQIDVFSYINNSHCCMIDNLIVMCKTGNYEHANYTIRYVDYEENELKPSRVAEGVVDHPVELLPSDTENFYSEDGTKKYIFDSVDAPDVAADGSTVVTVFFREAETYYAKLNCMSNGSYELLAQLTGSFFEGDNLTLYPSRGYGKDGKYYFAPASSWNGIEYTFPSALTPSVIDGKTTYTGILLYNEDASVAYYSDFERLALPTENLGEGTGLGQLEGTVNNWWSFYNNYFSRFSGGRSIRLDAGSYVWTEPIAEDGTYMVRIYGRNDKSANCEEPYALGYRDDEGNVKLFDVAVPDWGSATTGESIVGSVEEAAGIGLKAGWSLVVMNTGNGDMISLDDIKLTKVADYAEPPILDSWTDIIVNGDMEGENNECFYVTEQGIGGPFLARITDGIGKDGSRAVKVQSSDNPSADWATQFFIRLPYQLPEGKYRISFDYMADKEGDFDTQAHVEPGAYIHWACVGSGTFSTEWKHYEAEGTITADMSKEGQPFQTICFNLAKNKVATQFIFDNVKFEVPTDVLATLTKNPAVDPEPYPYLMTEAIALAADDEAVAVGKLREAIQWAKDNSDESKLQAAIDQFKADNADLEKDETEKVGTDTNSWSVGSGNSSHKATYTHNGITLIEHFGETRVGTMLSQEVSVENGTYNIEVYATSHNAWNGSYMPVSDDNPAPALQTDANDVAYVFGTSGANTVQTWITARRNSGMLDFEPEAYAINDVEVTDGMLTIGLALAKAGQTEWHTIQIKSLKWVTTAKTAYVASQAELAALVAEAKTLAADAGKTNGREEFIAVLETAEPAVGSNWYNIPEVEALIASLKTAIDKFRKANYFIDFAVGEYYIIDTESGLMMAAGHDWGTRGIVNELGLDLILTPNGVNRSVSINSRVSNGGYQNYLGFNLYMDADEYGWFLDYQGSGFYITNGEGQYISIDGAYNLVMSSTPREWIIVSKDGMMEQRLDELKAAAQDNPVDATFLIKAPNFNRNDARNAEAWSVSEDCTNKTLGGPVYGNVENYCAESYHSTFTISQTIAGAPAGLYQLTAQGFYRQEDGAEENAPQFFIGSATGEVPVISGSENSMADAGASFAAGLYTIAPIEFYYDGESSLTVGIEGTATHQWVAFDNFRLTYLGNDIDDGTVRLPKGLEIVSYGMIYKDYSGNDAFAPVNVAVDGSDVYFQGMSEYLPEAWVKGTKDGNTVTFPAMQYVGMHDALGSSYCFYNGDAVFTYDAVTDTYAAEGEIYGIIGDIYYDRYVFNPVIKRVVDMAAMPANPEITNMRELGYYGWYFDFNVPLVDINGNPLMTSKLAYKIYSDTKGVIEALTFTPETHTRLTGNMTEIPYGFTDSWDFYETQLYLNGLYSEKWDKIGIQSIYYGGGEVNATEVQWYDLRLVRAPEDLATQTYGFQGYDTYYSRDVTGEVQVGFYGEDEVYIQGLSKYLPKAWVKGKLVDGTLTIPRTYLGIYTESDGNWSEDYDLFFSGSTFVYDAEAGTFYSEWGYVSYETPEDEYFYDEFKYVSLTKLLDVAAIPANPEITNFNYLDTDYPILQFEIPTVDVNGNSLILSKLAYQIYYYKNDEQGTLVLTKDLYPGLDGDKTELPYGFKAGDIYPTIIYLNQPVEEIDSWHMIGIQSIYYGGGERNVSDIVWFINDNADGIKEIKNEELRMKNDGSRYSLDGRKLSAPQRGVNIIRYSDGTSKKVLVK